VKDLLVFDKGGSYLKVAYFAAGNLEWIKMIPVTDAGFSTEEEDSKSEKSLGISRLKKFLEGKLDLELSNVEMKLVQEFPSSILEKMGINGVYETMGGDRVCDILGAVLKMKLEESFIIVDAGTAITVDVVVAVREKSGFFSYKGGNILPGLAYVSNFFKGHRLLANFLSDQLGISDKNALLGMTTEWQVNWGYIASICAYINFLMKKFKVMNVIFTGGDGAKLYNFYKKFYLSKCNEEDSFISCEPYLGIWGVYLYYFN